MEHLNPTYKDMDFYELERYAEELQNHMFTCKCGHRVLIRKYEISSICNWCGRSVYRNKREEFRDRMETKLYGRKDKRRIQ